MFHDLIGIPYRLGGRDRFGMDCVAVVLAGLEAMGAPTACPWEGVRRLCVSQELPDPTMYPSGWRQTSELMQPGDVLVLRQPGQMVHLALVVGSSLALTTTPASGSYIARVSRLPGQVAMCLRPPQFEASR